MTALLEVRGLAVRFGGLTALDGISLEVRPGEIRGIIGPNGAGKTTLFNAVSGLAPAVAGRMIFAGEDVTHLAPHLRAARGIGRTFQGSQVFQGLTVMESVLIGCHGRLSVSLWGAGLRTAASRAAEREGRRWAREVLDFLGLDGLRLREVGALSFGQQRLVEIARAMVGEPRLLLLDEPAAGLSPPMVEELKRVFRKLREEKGTAILLVEHLMPLVMDVSDRVTVLNNGAVVAEGSPQAVAGDPAVKAAYLGEEEAGAAGG